MAYLIIFGAVLIEGPIATLAAAAVAAQDPHLDAVWVFFVAMFGNLTADLCWYLLGAAGKHGKVLEYIPWIRYQEGLVKRATKEIRQRGINVFILTKLGFGIGTIPLLIAAGMLHINKKRWLVAALAIEVVWTGTLLLMGVFASSNFHQLVTAFFEHALLWGLAFLALCGAILFFKNRATH